MAGSRIHGEFTSYAGVDYDIYIYDAEFVASISTNPNVIGDPTTGNVWGDPTTGAVWGWDALDDLENPPGIQTHKVGLPGFTLEYETQNEKLFTPLMPSRLTFKMMFENATQETFLNALANSYEGQFLVRVLRNNSLYWSGVLMPDVVEYEDQYYPFEFEFQAIDGLARLKSIDFPGAVSSGGAKDTLLEMIYSCFGQLETNGFYAAGDDYFVNNLDWWETRHVASFSHDPINLTQLMNGTFRRQVERSGITEYKYTSCYDVLFQICQAFGARLFHADGKWMMMQPTEYYLPVQTRRVYTKSAVLTYSTGGQGYDRTCDQDTLARAQGRWQYLAPVNKCTITYEFFGTSNYASEVGWDATQPPTDTGAEVFAIGEISNNAGEATADISIRINHKVNYAGLEPFRETKHLFRLVFKIGTYYLKRHFISYSILPDTTTYDPFTWSASADYVDLWTEKVPDWDNQLMKEEFTFVTPPLPTSDDAELNFYWVQCWDDTGTPVVPSGDILMQWGTYEEKLEVLGDGTNYEQSSALDYVATNTVTGNSTNVELKAMFGDGPNPGVKSHLETSNGSTWAASTLWGMGTGGARDKKLLELAASRIVAAQQTPRQKYVGRLINTSSSVFFDCFHRLKIGTRYYVFLGGTFEAVDDTWTNLHLFHIKTDLEPDTATVIKN